MRHPPKLSKLHDQLGAIQRRMLGPRIACGTMSLLLAIMLVALSSDDDIPRTILSYLWLISTIAFFGLVVVQRYYKNRQSLIDLLKLEYERIDQSQRGLPPAAELPEGLLLSESQKALIADLDLFGPHSLFGLLDFCVLVNGRRHLAQFLLATPNAIDERELLLRQTHAQKLELCAAWWLRLRGELALFGRTFPIGALNPQALDEGALVNSEVFKTELRLQLLVWLSFIVGLIASLSGKLSMQPGILIFGYIGWILFTRSSVQSAYLKAQNLSTSLRAIHFLLKKLARRRSYQRSEPETLGTSRTQFAAAIQELALWNAMMSVNAHPMAHLLLNLLLPWDYLVVWRMELWRERHQLRFGKWVTDLGQLDALMSLAVWGRFFAVTRPEIKNQPGIRGVLVRHPLISHTESVGNDIELNSDQRLVILTGSNMAGKSTFQRSIAINQILAQAGAKVLATSFTTSIYRLETSMRVRDHLDLGYSTFYYEVHRLSAVIKNLEQYPTLLFLDEIFRGTNNRERLMGSQALLGHLANSNQAYGWIATHDLELAELTKNHPSVRNMHFADFVDPNGELSFDYKLKPGPSTSTNALIIMKRAGLPVAAIED